MRQQVFVVCANVKDARNSSPGLISGQKLNLRTPDVNNWQPANDLLHLIADILIKSNSPLSQW